MLNNQATLLEDTGQHDRADVNYMRSLSIFRGAAGIGPEHRYIADVLHSMATLRLDRGEPGEAEGRCREALEMRRTLLGDDHRETVESQKLLDRIHDATETRPAPLHGSIGAGTTGPFRP